MTAMLPAGRGVRLSVRIPAGEASASAELTREVIADNHNASFDLHLPDRNVERTHQAANIVEAIGRILQQQRVRAFVDRYGATLGKETAAARLSLDQIGEVR